MPSIRVIVYPCGVQGKGAGDEIAQAIRKANARHECDLLIVCRGGGSIEDLWAFNEEAMARAVLESELPVVSGVGHETDFTICDFVADVRAETPTAAATLVAPDRAELDARARSALLRVRSQALRALEQRMQRTDQLAGRLRHPAARLRERLRALRQLATRLALAWRSHHAHRVMRFEPLLARWTQRVQVEWPQREAVRHSAQLLSRAAAARMQVLAARVAQCELALAHLNPEAVLARGYSLVLRADGSIVQSSRDIALGERLQLRFAHGDARVEVREKSD
jgi:exodeoxyribonuclease VII large subunit